jgi:NADH-quinone oxidoreductase subunit C
VTASTWVERVQEAYLGAGGPGAGGLVAGVEEEFGLVGVDVPQDRWTRAVTVARESLGCTFFDWLSAVDELEEGFRMVCHLAARRTGAVEHLVVRTRIPRDLPVVASVAGVFGGARWHERETHEMFGIDFTEDGAVLPLEGLLLPEEFEGHPLRKDFVLASRVAKPWPGAKEPGESDDRPRPGRARRRALPPGVPDPGQWPGSTDQGER